MLDETEFHIRLPDIAPDDLSIGLLAEVLHHSYAAIVAQAREEDPDVPDDDLKVSLVQVKSGSTGLRLHAPERAAAVIYLIAAAVQRAAVAQLASKAAHEIEGLQALSTRLATPIELRAGQEGTRLLAAIAPDTSVQGNRLRVSGGTDIYGTLLRVGGVSPRAFVELDDGRRISCALQSRQLARRLAPLLYTIVGLRGTATWFANTWELVTFSAQDVIECANGDVTDSIRALRAVTGKHWDAIDDVDAYLRELREDSPE